MPKNNRSGKAEILSVADYEKIFRILIAKHHKLLWLIAEYSGERWGAIRQLKVSDVYADPVQKILKPAITFRAATRKKSPSGMVETRQIPIHPRLAQALEAYEPPLTGWLFPSPSDSTKPITLKACDLFLRSALVKLHWQNRGISLHSTRRSFITTLHEKGCDIRTIQAITGHKDLKALSGYVEIRGDRLRNAIALL